MTYGELKQIFGHGTLVKVKGGVYDYMFLKAIAPVMVEMNGVNQAVDASQIELLTEYDKAMIKRMYEAVFPKTDDTRFNQVWEFVEKLK